MKTDSGDFLAASPIQSILKGPTECFRYNAALRELKEETGIVPKNKLVFFYNFERGEFYNSMYTLELEKQTKVKPQDKFSQWKWFKLSEIQNLNLNEWDQIPLKKYAEDQRTKVG